MKKSILLWMLGIAMFACSDDNDNLSPSDRENLSAALDRVVLMDAPLNGDANDRGPEAMDGTSHNVTATSDRANNANSALSFNGTNAYVDFGSGLDTDSISTISIWAKFDTLFSGMPDMELVSKSAYRQGMEIVIYKNRLQFFLVGVEDNNNIGIPVTSLEANRWYHIVTIYDRSAGQMKMYIDGKLQASDRAPSEITKIDKLMLGNWSFGDESRFFKGQLDDFSIYSRPVTDSEVQYLFEAPARSR